MAKLVKCIQIKSKFISPSSTVRQSNNNHHHIYKQREGRILETFHRIILNGGKHVTKVEVFEWVDVIIIETMLLVMEKRWEGPVARMKDKRLPTTVHYELSTGPCENRADKKGRITISITKRQYNQYLLH